MKKKNVLIVLCNMYGWFYFLCNTVWIRWYLLFLKNRIIQDICQSWLRFEREFGKLEDFDHALHKVFFFLFKFIFIIFELCIIFVLIKKYVADIEVASA